MKKGVLFAFMVVCINWSFAQKFKGGLTAGLSSCQVDGDGLSGYNKPGGIAGSFITWSFNDKFSAQMEMEYIQKGARKTPKPQNGNTLYLIRLNYVEVPLLIQYVNKTFIYETGFSFGTLLSSYVGNEFGEITHNASNPDFFKYEYSFNLGVGKKFSDKWGFNFRYNYSLYPVRDFPGARSILFRSGQYNNNMQFTLRYFFVKKGD